MQRNILFDDRLRTLSQANGCCNFLQAIDHQNDICGGRSRQLRGKVLPVGGIREKVLAAY